MGFYIAKIIGGLLIWLKCSSVWEAVLEESKSAAQQFLVLLQLVNIRVLGPPREVKGQLTQWLSMQGGFF